MRNHTVSEKPVYEILKEIPLNELRYYAGEFETLSLTRFDYRKLHEDLRETEEQIEHLNEITSNEGMNTG